MEEIDANPDVLLLGKDPDAASFLELVYPSTGKPTKTYCSVRLGEQKGRVVDHDTVRSRHSSGSLDNYSAPLSEDSGSLIVATETERKALSPAVEAGSEFMESNVEGDESFVSDPRHPRGLKFRGDCSSGKLASSKKSFGGRSAKNDKGHGKPHASNRVASRKPNICAEKQSGSDDGRLDNLSSMSSLSDNEEDPLDAWERAEAERKSKIAAQIAELENMRRKEEEKAIRKAEKRAAKKQLQQRVEKDEDTVTPDRAQVTEGDLKVKRREQRRQEKKEAKRAAKYLAKVEAKRRAKVEEIRRQKMQMSDEDEVVVSGTAKHQTEDADGSSPVCPIKEVRDETVGFPSTEPTDTISDPDVDSFCLTHLESTASEQVDFSPSPVDTNSQQDTSLIQLSSKPTGAKTITDESEGTLASQTDPTSPNQTDGGSDHGSFTKFQSPSPKEQSTNGSTGTTPEITERHSLPRKRKLKSHHVGSHGTDGESRSKYAKLTSGKDTTDLDSKSTEGSQPTTQKTPSPSESYTDEIKPSEPDVEERRAHLSSGKSPSAPESSPDPVQLLKNLSLQLKSSLVRGQENFTAAVNVFDQICQMKVSLLQLTQAWELTDCVKKCRRYKLSADVRDKAHQTLAHFQKIQAAATKQEIEKAKAIVAERVRQVKPQAAPVTHPTITPPPSSTPPSQDPSVDVTPNPQTKKFSVEELRAELDAQANLLLARLAATDARLNAERSTNPNSQGHQRPIPSGLQPPAPTLKATEDETASVMSRVDEVANRLLVSKRVPPPPPAPQIDLDTRINQMMGVATPAPAPLSPPPAELLAIREQIQQKRRAKMPQAQQIVVGSTEDEDLYDLLGV
uniref:PWWP domain-containing protein n=1 Tax=Mesocestoides corti TaxID=53468 RepID=A0A5K3EMH6_MESCO